MIGIKRKRKKITNRERIINIAKEYVVTGSTIRNIKNGRNWKFITNQYSF